MTSLDPALQDRVGVLLAEIGELPDWLGIAPSSVHSRNALGDTPLHVAAVRGDTHAVTDLLTAGADPNVRGEYGYTPLHEAVAQQHHEIVRLLLAHGAFCAEPNDLGNTPVDTARLFNDDIMVAFLE